MSVQVTTASTKTVSSKSPYIGTTFQILADNIFGEDGYLSGGNTTDDGSLITVEPFVMISRGIIGETLTTSVVDVPVGDGQWYLLASIPDDNPDSGIIVQATQSLQIASSGTVIATRSDGVWRNPPSISIGGAREKATEPGTESGFSASYKNTGDVYDATDGTTVVETIYSNKGRLVNPGGIRGLTPAEVGGGIRQLSISPPPASTLGDRTDRIVLRQRESFSEEVVHLVGPTRPADLTRVTLGPGRFPDYYGDVNGGTDDQWWAWADGSDIHIYGGMGAGFGDIVAVSGGSSKLSVRIVGQRKSDGALVVLYTDPGSLQMFSFHPSTGAIINAPISVESIDISIEQVSAVFDHNGDVRIVFQWNNSGRQVYTHKVSAANTTFGAELQVPDRVLQGGDTGNIELHPEIQVSRDGISHISYISGSNVAFGTDLIYVRVDSDNIILSTSTHPIVSAVGKVGSDVDLGAVAQSDYTRIYNQSMTITPHDEVYIILSAYDPTTVKRDGLLLFSPLFSEQAGYPVLEVVKDASWAILDVSVTNGAGGELSLSVRENPGGNTHNLHVLNINVEPASDGILDFILDINLVASVVAVTTDAEIASKIGPSGELVHAWKLGADIQRIHSPGWWAESPNVHSNDTLLHSINIAKHASSAVEESGVELLSPGHKNTKCAVVVGGGGDYQGYDALGRAMKKVSKDGGGTVILRGGYQGSGLPIAIPPNVSLIGDLGATISGGGNISIQGVSIASLTAITGNVIESTTEVDKSSTASGSWVLMTGAGSTGWHQIDRRLRNRSDGGVRILLKDGVGGVNPAGVGADLYVSNIRIENIAIDGTLTVRRAKYCTFKNICMKADLVNSLIGDSNYQCKFEDVDFSDSFSGAGLFGTVFSGYGNTYEGFTFEDGDGTFQVSDTEQHVTIIGGHGDNSDPAADSWRSTGTRTTPIYLIGAEGKWASFGNEVQIITSVGGIISQGEGLGTLRFDDDETRGDSGPLLLSVVGSGTGNFNGATPQVIINSVNERVKTSGDAMSGNLTTDGSTRTLGASGAVGDRFNLFANTVNALGLMEAEEGAVLKKTTTLGGSLLSAISDADIARIVVQPSTFAGVEYTLIMQCAPSANFAYRKYVSSSGELVETLNAFWNNTTNLWAKDVAGAGIESTIRRQSESRFSIQAQVAGATTWADGAWLIARSDITEVPVPPMFWRQSDLWVGPGTAFGSMDAAWTNTEINSTHELQIPLLGMESGDWLHGFDLYLGTNANPSRIDSTLYRTSTTVIGTVAGSVIGTNPAAGAYFQMGEADMVGAVPAILIAENFWYMSFLLFATAGSSVTANFARMLISKPAKDFNVSL